MSLPLIFFNILFSDPAPYFTLCTYGCFSIEPCTTKDQNWGNMISMSFVFALGFLLSANVLAIWFITDFLKLKQEEIDELIKEVRQKFEVSIKKIAEGKDDDSEEEEDEQDDTKAKENIEKDLYEIHSEKDVKETEDILLAGTTMKSSVKQENIKYQNFRLEFSDVSITMRPINYIKK
ncbi:hypothetical protein SteCoe_29343 [Stentor coeruleus]|uniref:Uncharacterized protein n=1 Tax=Stentor coeruleus TaxID=5963 RepID=A0A1R2B643_9CILI|nr:hypothetical protein SteCoe_29343 [Stentor coeruleus]